MAEEKNDEVPPEDEAASPRKKWKNSYEANRRYLDIWEKDIPWITSTTVNGVKLAFCKLCMKTLQPHRGILVRHQKSEAHRRLTQSNGNYNSQFGTQLEMCGTGGNMVFLQSGNTTAQASSPSNVYVYPSQTQHSVTDVSQKSKTQQESGRVSTPEVPDLFQDKKYDSVDLFFASVAQSAKQIPECRRWKIQMEIFRIVNEALFEEQPQITSEIIIDNLPT